MYAGGKEARQDKDKREDRRKQELHYGSTAKTAYNSRYNASGGVPPSASGKLPV
jgi:hypothetical protein